MSKDVDVSVLVVGAGPTGLTAAHELARRGVECRIIDKAEKPSDKSRALTLHARTLEYFENMGLIEDALAQGTPGYGISVYDHKNRIVHVTFDELDCPYPYVLLIPQNRTEQVLANRLHRLGVSAERPVELLNLVEEGNAVVSTIRKADGKEETIRSRWLIGTDGAHSTTRHLLGVDFEGDQYDDPFALGDVKVEGDVAADEITTFLNEKGNVLVLPFGNGRFRVMTNMSPDYDISNDLTLEKLQALVDERGPGGLTLSDPHWLAWFHLNRRSVKQYRHGRIFLAGDSAHIHSPAGGQGMNTGIQDAFNLSWKLALVDKGAAPEALLDSYQQERHPVGQALLKGTDAATKMITIRQPIAQKLRNQMMHFLSQQEFIQHRLLRAGSMMAVNYRHSPIVGEFRSSQKHHFAGVGDIGSTVKTWLEFAHGPAPGDRAPDAVLITADSKEEVRLFETMRGIKHNLLLFAYPGADKDELMHLHNIAQQSSSQWGKHMGVCIILADQAGSVPPGVTTAVYRDPDAVAHHKYGASHECLYLIRPDGFVGFRSQPADFEALSQHLKLIFCAAPAVANIG